MKLRIIETLSHREPIISVLLTLAIVLVISVLAANAQTQTLTAGNIGPGAIGGRITSSPAAIDCGSTCSADFNTNNVVTLIAAPVAGGLATFTGWTGACSGTTATCDVTLDSAKAVGTRFTQPNTFEKCVGENPNLWGLRFSHGAGLTVGSCRTSCLNGGGNGYFLLNKATGLCLCGTSAKPFSTGANAGICDLTCPAGYPCGNGATGRYAAYNTMAPATAAGLSVSGRVLSEIGRPVGKAIVTITDRDGNRQTALTSPFGYYKFETVTAGDSYFIEVNAKGYEFEPRPITVGADLTDVDFTALSLLFPQKE